MTDLDTLGVTAAAAAVAAVYDKHIPTRKPLPDDVAAARAAVAAYRAATLITTPQELNELPAGARVALGDYYLKRMEEEVDDSVWMDLGNGCMVDQTDLAYLVNQYPAQLVHVEGMQ